MSLLVGAVAAAGPSYAGCGDGVVELGEECDEGPLGSACCDANCMLAPAGLQCRPADGACDVPEVCDGSSPTCPVNTFLPAQVCRPAAGPCDLPESCSGIGPACPADSLASPSVTCRPAATACDVPEVCTGTELACPDDTGEPDGDGDGVCDRQDVCPLVADPHQSDEDGDGIGDACDACTNIADGKMEGPQITLSKLSAPPGDDRLRIKVILRVHPEPRIDPLVKGLRIVLRGPLGDVFDAVIPPKAFDPGRRIGWSSEGAGRWSYKNIGPSAGRIAGIKLISLRQDQKDLGRIRLVVSGRGSDMQAVVGQPSLTLTVATDAPIAATGQCAETQFAAVGNAPDCRLLNTSRRLTCRKKR